jgi:hypothetical protein
MSDTNYTAPGSIPADFWVKAVQYSKVTGADPYLLSAIAQHETGFGTLGAGRQGYTLGYGVYSETLQNPLYKGTENQLMFAGRQIESYFGSKPVTLQSLTDFMKNSWKPGDQEWAAKVYKYYAGYDKNPELAKNQNALLGTVKDMVKDSAAGQAVSGAVDSVKALPGKILYVVILVLIVAGIVFSGYQVLREVKA